MASPLPLAPVMIAIESIALEPQLSVVGIDLDSGHRVAVRVSTPDTTAWIAQNATPTVGLVLVLTLTTIDALAPTAI